MRKWIICRFLVILILIPWTNVIKGQETSPDEALFIVGLKAHYGFIIPHSKWVEPVSHTNPWGIETDICWHLRKKNYWNYCFCYPRTGFSVYYINFDNPKMLGSTIAIYPFIEPYIRAEKPLNFSIRFGIGPSIMTKIYDSITNPNNLMYGSRLSFIALLNFSINYRIDNRVMVRLTGNYNHISNGGLKEPNYGINFPTLNAGLDYSFTTTRFADREKDLDIVLNPKKNRFDIIFLFSGKPIAHGVDKRYAVFGFCADYSRVMGRIFALTGGAEWVSDRSLRQRIIINDIVDESGDYVDHYRAAILVGVEWLFGRFIFSQQLGIYVYCPYKDRNPVYQRYGLSFKISDHIYTGINIKTHAQDADFMDMRLGVYF
jgi:hypothetical protein